LVKGEKRTVFLLHFSNRKKGKTYPRKKERGFIRTSRKGELFSFHGEKRGVEGGGNSLIAALGGK